MSGTKIAEAAMPAGDNENYNSGNNRQQQQRRKEEEEERCWRKNVDDKLKRLHSLLFGAELALERNDAEVALGLSLRLAGFLDSQNTSTSDHVFVSPIRSDALDKIRTAFQMLAPQSDRGALEQANCQDNEIFCKEANADLEKIKKSRFFKAVFGHDAQIPCAVRDANTFNPHAASLPQKGSQIHAKSTENYQTVHASVIPKQLTQAKLTSLYDCRNTKKSSEVSVKGISGSVEGTSFGDLVQKKTLQSSSSKMLNTSSLILVDEDDGAYANNTKRRRRYLEANRQNDFIDASTCENAVQENRTHTGFVTAKLKLAMDNMQKQNSAFSPTSCSQTTSSSAFSNACNGNSNLRAVVPKSLGMSRRGVRGNFIPPVRMNGSSGSATTSSWMQGNADNALEESTKRCLEMLVGPDGELPDKLRNLEPRLIEHVSNEIMDQDPNVRWDDIAGLDHAKKCVTEMVIWPLLRPDIFKGCRSPGKGLLLFGPPGTGKTMIGKAIAGEAKATFFYISASSLTSKWIGEGEKLVRALFGVASCRQPAVIFVDEIDSLLSQRKSDGEHESSRRLKTQFLIEMEGFDSGNEQLLLIGATNRPQELDEAARRRLTKRLYIPLPSGEARAWIIRNLLQKDGLFALSDEEITTICKITEGYSGSDMKNLVKDASMGPLREALRKGIDITMLKKEDMRPVMIQDFQNSLQEVRPSVSQNELGTYEEWNRQFGSLSLSV